MKKSVENFGLQLSSPPDDTYLNIFIGILMIVPILTMIGLLLILGVLIFAFLVSVSC